jgi:methionyl-tRNA synthetase
MEKYYLTTPIYYVNAAPHIGHAYTTFVAETIKRLKTMQGYHVTLTTGTDEHGQKVERSAKAAGKTPVEFTHVVADEFRRQWKELDLRIDRFQRTSDKRHHATVQWLFQRCLERGYIYTSSYTGQYCVFDELYVADAKPGDPCPDCGRPTETVTEENLFFKLSAFQDKLLALYERQPDFIQPESRRNEVIAFVKGGLTDLSISRTTIKWGIPVPDHGAHVFYVWFDALIAYMTAVKESGLEGEEGSLWPANLHLIGKEIVRFHAIYWPAFLMAGEVPLPKQIYAHGWLLFEQDKMSKSRGNIVRPDPIRKVMGADALRYFLLREVVFGQDGSFSYDALVGRYNSDLANGLGNLASRTLTMIQQYRQGAIPAGNAESMAKQAGEAVAAALNAYNAFEFSKALEAAWGLISAADKFIVQQAPWTLARKTDEASRQQLDDTLYASAEVLRIATVLLAPVIPDSCGRIWAQLGMEESLDCVRLDLLEWGQLAPGQAIGEIQAVFPRIEAKQVIARMRELEVEETARQNALLGKQPAPAPEAETAGEGSPKIGIEDFAKVDLRVGQVVMAEPVKGAGKLLHLKVDIGEAQPRTLVAGIAEAYTPDQLIGRKVVIVANLQPRKLRGIESNGMIVAASVEGGKPVLAGFLEDIPIGARLK